MVEYFKNIQYTPRDLDILTRTLDGEAEGEPNDGQVAIAWTIRHRVERPGWWSRDPNDDVPDDTIAAVCLDPKQFSCWNGGPCTERIKALSETNPHYMMLRAIALNVLEGVAPDPTARLGGATHYKVQGTRASWDSATVGKQYVVIGKHIFFNLGLHG